MIRIAETDPSSVGHSHESDSETPTNSRGGASYAEKYATSFAKEVVDKVDKVDIGLLADVNNEELYIRNYKSIVPWKLIDNPNGSSTYSPQTRYDRLSPVDVTDVTLSGKQVLQITKGEVPYSNDPGFDRYWDQGPTEVQLLINPSTVKFDFASYTPEAISVLVPWPEAKGLSSLAGLDKDSFLKSIKDISEGAKNTQIGRQLKNDIDLVPVSRLFFTGSKNNVRVPVDTGNHLQSLLDQNGDKNRSDFFLQYSRPSE